MADEQSLREQIQETLKRDDPHKAFDLAKELDKVILASDQNDTEIVKRLEKVRAQLMLVALRYYGATTLENLFLADLVSILQSPETIDPIDHVKSRLLSESFVEDRNDLRDKLLSAMRRSENIIGDEKITLGSEVVTQTVANWIKLYVSEVGTGNPSNVKIARFFAQNASVAKLSAANKVLLRKMFNLYNYLLLRSDDPAGYEGVQIIDTGTNVGMLSDGNYVEVYDNATIRNLREQGRRGELSPLQLTDLQIRFPDQFNDIKIPQRRVAVAQLDPEVVRQQTEKFFAENKAKYEESAKKETPKNAVLAEQMATLSTDLSASSVLALVKATLAKNVSDQKTFTAFFRKPEVKAFLLQNYPKALGENNKRILEQSFFSPLGFEAFLRILLEGVYQLQAEEAKWHAYQIVQRFPIDFREFKTIVTYDVNENALVWRY